MTARPARETQALRQIDLAEKNRQQFGDGH
jgi:hypothetical protein